MFDFDEHSSSGSGAGETRYTDPTDRVNGEYHYKNGYTQKIYSDAHYVHENETTVPPRYYTPPEKTVKEPKDRTQTIGAAKLFLLCIACALVGGVIGAAIVSSQILSRVNEMQDSVAAMQEEMLSAESKREVAAAAAAKAEGVSPSVIYDDACRQVVSIKTEVIYNSFFGRQISSTGSGSGFIVSPDGYIITNYHVIEAAYKAGSAINVALYDGSVYPAAVVGADEGGDIAVLKIDAEGLCPAQLGSSDTVLVGDTVYTVGNPLSWLEFSMTTGHVSALNREIAAGDNISGINMFQLDAPVNSGNSGGPVYNDRGEVIGIVTAKYSETGVEGLGFAIPISDARAKINDLITKGYVTGQACISLSVDSRYNSVYSKYYGMPLGAYVASVDAGGCAEKAGILPGDIITRVGDRAVTGYNELVSALKHFSAGEEAEVELFRAGDSMKLTIVFDEIKPGK